MALDGLGSDDIEVDNADRWPHCSYYPREDRQK